MKLKIDDHEIDVLSTISVATAFTILVSYYSLYTYYALFGIYIIPFLDSTEIIFAFSPFYIILVAFTVSYVLYRTLYKRYIAAKNELRIWKRITLLLVLFAICFGVYLYFIKDTNVRNSLITIVLAQWIFSTIDDDRLTFKVQMGIITFLLILTIRWSNYNYYRSIEKGVPEYFVRCKTDQVYLESNSNLNFVGMTNRYIFFFHRSDSVTRAYSIENVHWVDMKYNKDFNP